MGSLPTHPELLDWLASEFMTQGESLKKLHRLIVTSATYRQVSSPRKEAARVDAGNRYLWRMNRARLDAESVRDAVLAVTGKLDLTMGGPCVRQFYFKDDHSPIYDYARFDVEDPTASVAAFIASSFRSVPDPFMECLDCADPSLLTPTAQYDAHGFAGLGPVQQPLHDQPIEAHRRRVERKSDEPRARSTPRIGWPWHDRPSPKRSSC